jgi:AraC-like DNA-binding protein
MEEDLLRRLAEITEEERALLAGSAVVEKSQYTAARDFTIDSNKMLQKGRLIDIRPHTRFVHFPCHRHNYVEIIYMCAGSTTHIVNGGERVVLATGDLLFLNQTCTHEILPAGAEDLAVNFMVLPAFFDESFRLLEKDSLLGAFLMSALRQGGDGGQYLYFHASDLLPVQNLAENLIWSLLCRREKRRRIDQLTMALLFLQLQEHADRIEGPGRHEDRPLMASLQYIEEHYRTARLGELAKSLGQAPPQLSRLIRMGTGSTFKGLLQKKRLQQAAHLLRETTLPVADVMAAVGYDNSSYFYRIFRSMFGVSPREYRAEHRLEPGK